MPDDSKKEPEAEKKHRGWNGGRKPAGDEVADSTIVLRVSRSRKAAYVRQAQSEETPDGKKGKTLSAWMFEHLDKVAKYPEGE